MKRKGPIKILLVDDEEEFASTLAERLELRGFDVRTARDGQTALGLVDESPPDVILLDLVMPGLSGIEVLKLLKAGKSPIPTIVLTARGDVKDGIEGMRLGAFDFLAKPFSLEALVRRIREAVSP